MFSSIFVQYFLRVKTYISAVFVTFADEYRKIALYVPARRHFYTVFKGFSKSRQTKLEKTATDQRKSALLACAPLASVPATKLAQQVVIAFV